MYKFTFLDDGSIRKSVWIDESIIKNSEVFKGNDYSYINLMTNWQLDGEYIYFTFIPGIEYFNTEMKDAYRLGKISKDGTSIEFIDDTIAFDYVVKDGWIYFYDNGFVYEGSINYSYDNNREGLYKMRVNGTGRQLIYGDIEKNPGDYREHAF